MNAWVKLGVLLIPVLIVQGCVHSEAQGPQSGMNFHHKTENSPIPAKAVQLKGFEISPYWNEQIKTYNFDTDVRIQINAPSADTYVSNKPTRLILYALPNGNSIEQTVGKKLKPGDDWHFNIQHIGAQTRKLREVMKDENIVVAYLEATPKSWPSFGGRNDNNLQVFQRIVQSVIDQLPKRPDYIVLSSHSGGGSFIFNFMNSYNEIPDWVNRISFLDSVYNFSISSTYRHDEKWINWLKSKPDHYLSLICYRDKDILYDGKPVRGAISGEKTLAIVQALGKTIPLSVTTTGDYVHWSGLNGRLDIILHLNPENKILHTVLVEKNGFAYAMTVGTKYENKAGIFWGDAAYTNYIQE